MKMFPESQLPLKPRRFTERYLLYSFEGRARWLAPQLILFSMFLFLWAVSQYWPLGVLAAMQLFGVYLAFEARTIVRMIQRDGADHERTT